MDDPFYLSLLVALGVVVVIAIVFRWVRYTVQRRKDLLRAHGYRLIHCLNAYSAWVDYQRDDALLDQSTDELTSPEPLAQALAIKEAAFPSLGQHMLRLLQAHSRLMEYLWQHNLLRLSQATGWVPAYQDPQYQQIRGAQEDLIEEVIAIVHEIIGETEQNWRRTGTDFSFSSSITMPTQVPGSGA